MRHIVIYKPFSIVIVPFPFIDIARSKRRLALVISTEKFQVESRHVTCLMITSAKHRKWFGDYLITDLASTKLPVESYIRQKVFTIDLRLIPKKLGSLSERDIIQVKNLLKKCIAC